MQKEIKIFLDWKEKILFLSDLHLGDRSLADNFTSDEKLINVLHYNTYKYIIIVGDFLELWQFDWNIIRQKYSKLLEYLKDKNVICVLGNHDWRIQKIKDFPFSFCERVVIYKNSNIGKTEKIFVIHGHQFDTLLKNPKTFWFFRFWAWLYKFIEKSKAEELIFKQFVSPRNNKFLARYYKKKAEEFLFKTNNTILVMGHTHIRDKSEFNLDNRKKIYYNIGCWTDGKEDYLIL